MIDSKNYHFFIVNIYSEIEIFVVSKSGQKFRDRKLFWGFFVKLVIEIFANNYPTYEIN